MAIIVSTKYTVVHYTMYCLYCTPYTVRRTLYGVQCAHLMWRVMYAVHCTAYSVHNSTSTRPIYIVHYIVYRVYIIGSTVYASRCNAYTVRRTQRTVHILSSIPISVSSQYHIGDIQEDLILYGIQCTPYTVQRTLYAVQYAQYNVPPMPIIYIVRGIMYTYTFYITVYLFTYVLRYSTLHTMHPYMYIDVLYVFILFHSKLCRVYYSVYSVVYIVHNTLYIVQHYTMRVYIVHCTLALYSVQSILALYSI